MVYKICEACRKDNSWRYHSADCDLISFFKTLCNSFSISTSITSSEFYLCHACYGTLVRTKEYIENLRASTSNQTSSTAQLDPSGDKTCGSTELQVIHALQQPVLSSIVQLDQPSDLISAVTEVNQSEEDCEGHVKSAGLKRLYHRLKIYSYAIAGTVLTGFYNLTKIRPTNCSFHSHTKMSEMNNNDHSYFGENEEEHGYCNLYGQECSENEDTDDDKDENEDETLKKITDKLPSMTEKRSYDYPSILRKKDLTSLVDDDIFLDVIEEMIGRCPDLLQTLITVAVKKNGAISMRHISSVVMSYSCLMFARYNRNSAIQRCLTLLAVKGNANDEFIRRLNHLCLTLSCSGKIKLLEKANNTTKNKLVQAVKENPRIKITGDNLDMYIRTNHQRQDNHNRDIHWFASNITMSRLDYLHISNEKSDIQVEDIKAENFLVNESEASKLKDVKKVIIGRIIGETDHFKWILKQLPAHIPHRHSEYMSRKQEVFGLPVIFKNESKNEDCMDIMDEYETQLIDIFSKAFGNLEELGKHGAILGGDQLTRERLQNVKNIRYLAATPKGRFQHLNPIVCEFWHVKQDLLAKAYKALFKAESMEKGTLNHAKIILRRTDVTGKVKSNYKAHEELLLLMVKALIKVAADEESVETKDRDKVLDNIFSKLHGQNQGEDDKILNYYVNLMIWGLQLLNMNDTAKEGDLERVITNCKENIPFFYGHSTCSKYYSEMVNTILLSEFLLSPEMKLRMLEGCFINTKGGPGKNKESDLVQEHSIRNKKELIRSLGANKTEVAVTRACSAADTCYRCESNMDKRLGLPKMSVNHTKKTSNKDLETMVKVLKQIKPFQYEKGRKFTSFSKMPKNPKLIVSSKDMLQAIQKKIFRLYLNC